MKSRRTRRHAPAQTRNSRESSHFVAGEREIVRPPNTNLPPIISFNNNNNDKPPPYVNTRAVTINTDPPTVVPRSSAGTPVPSAAAAGGHNGSMTNIRLPAPHKSGSSSNCFIFPKQNENMYTLIVEPSMRPGYQPLPSIANPGAFNPNESFNTSFSHTPSVSADV